MQINNNSYCIKSFCAKQSDADKNPISKTGEFANLLKSTAVAGVLVGGRALFYLGENGFEFDWLWDKAKWLVDKNKEHVKDKPLHYLGAFGALIVGFIGAVSAIYTLTKTPQIIYQGKINAYTKHKDMDVYIKSNEVEKELYNQMNDKAKDANSEEKRILAQQYLKLKAAKNQIPDSLKPIQNNK